MRNKLTAVPLCILLSLLFLSQVSATTLRQETDSGFSTRMQAVRFSDVEALPANHWSKPAIYTMSALGIFKGDGTIFNPTGTTTRSEALALIMRAAGLENIANLTYKELQNQRQKAPYKFSLNDVWADGYIRLAVDYGILSVDQYNFALSRQQDFQYTNRIFDKTGAVTRLETAEWFVRIFGIPVAEQADIITDFKDFSSIPEDKIPFIEAAVKHGIIKGSGDNSLSMQSTITRQELAQMLFNIRDIVCRKNGISITTEKVLDSVTETVSATDEKMINRTELLLSDSTRFLVTRTYTLSGMAVDYNQFTDTDTDILTCKTGQAPSGINLLNRHDKIELFADQNGTVFFILCIEEKPEFADDVLNESYEEGEYVTGSIYFADEKNNLLIIKNNDEYIEIPYMEGMQVFYRNQSVAISDLVPTYLDYPCVVFRAKKETGMLYRAYRLQITDFTR